MAAHRSNQFPPGSRVQEIEYTGNGLWRSVASHDRHDWSISSSDNLPFPSIIVFPPPLLSLSLILSFFHPQSSNLKGPRSYRTIPRIVTLFPDVTSMLNRKVKRQFAVDGEEDRLIIIVL